MDKDLVQGIIGDFEAEVQNDINLTGPRQQKLMEDDKAADLEALQQAWIEEKTVPEILPYREQLIERLLERIRTQLEFIEMNSVELQTHEKDIKLMLVIVESELERIQFLIRAYVRLRLQKIDKYALFIRSNESELAKLTGDEVTYMEGHLAMLHELFREQYLKKMPHGADNTGSTNLGEDPDMIDEPDLDKHVFIRCVQNSRITLGRGAAAEELSLAVGEVYVIRYRSVRALIERGETEVI